MSHIKFVSPAGWDFADTSTALIRISSRGLTGADRQEFLKRASHSFVADLENIKFAADEVPVHLIALGASETYGPNRNGDGFKAACCRKHHPTFVKFAKFFRNHRNKPERGDPSYGVVKASAFNEKMQRVELLCALNATKAAAARNGGLVADAELEKLAKGEDLPVSMACHIAHDVCSFCRHVARSRNEYCTHEKCAAGGCRSNLTRLVKVGNDVHHLHVDNPDPCWFDISRVFRPADRIAYGARADYLTKAASDQGLFALQDCIQMSSTAATPVHVLLYRSGQHGSCTAKQAAQMQLAYGLAAFEQQLPVSAYANMPLPSQPFPVEKLAAYGSVACQTQLAALAQQQILLTLRDFARLSNRQSHYKAAATLLPRLFTEFTSNEVLPWRIEQGGCDFIEKQADTQANTLAIECRGDYSLNHDVLLRRICRVELQGSTVSSFISSEKSAGELSETAIKLAEDYAIYKLAALWRVAENEADFPLTVRLSIRQNQMYAQ